MEKRLNFVIRQDLHTQIKIEAAKRQITMTEFILKAIKRELSLPRETGGEAEPREG